MRACNRNYFGKRSSFRKGLYAGVAAATLFPAWAFAEDDVPNGDQTSGVMVAAAQDAKESTANKGETKKNNATAGTAAKAARPEEVLITAQHEDYKIEDVTSVGPFGNMSLQDTPYSVNVTPEALIRNRNVHTESDALRTNPTVVPLAEANVYSSLSRVMIRGFPAADQNDLRDGMTDRSFTLPPIENVSRIEVFNGLSGFLYGFSEPGGTVNYITKDPLPTAAVDVSAGIYGGGIGYGDVDAGGPITDGVNYRLILHKEDGSTYLDGGKQNRFLGAGVVNFQLAENTSLKFDFYHQYFDVKSLESYFQPYTLAGVVQVPKAPDTSQQWGQPWTFNTSQKEVLGVRFQSELNDVFTLRLAYRYGTMWRSYDHVDGIFTATPGVYNERYIIAPRQFEYTNTGYALVDAHFHTGSIEHAVTFGYTGSGFIFMKGEDSAPVIMGTSNLQTPALFSQPVIPGYQDVLSRHQGQFLSNYLIGDQITFDPQWSVLTGVNYATFRNWLKPLPGNPIAPTDYTQEQASPSFALMYKPTTTLTLYGSFIQGLAAGGTAPQLFTFNNVTKPVVNAGDMLSPGISRQYEVGAKGNFSGMYLTAALFRINKISEEVDPADWVYKQDGREVHEGLELTATGSVTDNLTVVGGLTWMRARIENATATPALSDKIPFGVPEKEARLYLEYAIPGIPKLTTSFGANYFGKRPVDNLNTGFIPGVTTFDAGIRYEPVLWGHETSFNLTVSNLFDKSYWASVSDYGEGLLLGGPRVVAFSTRVSL